MIAHALQVCHAPVTDDLLSDYDLSDVSSPSPPIFSPVESSSDAESTSSSASSVSSLIADNDRLICHQSQVSSDESSQCIPPCLAYPHWTGFILVGDNIDRCLRPRHQTMESRTQSFHYFNSYAVLDRCDFSSFEDTISSPVNLSDYDVEKLLPSSSDLEHLYQNFSTLVGRMLTEHVPGFAKYKHLAKDHIQHIYDKEMSKPSTVVSHLVTIIIIVLHANIYHIIN